MLKGDLTSTPLAPLLRDLASDAATGCLHVTNPVGDEALIFVKNGLIYSVSVPGTRPQLGAKLVSSGALAPEALAEALEAQRSELQGWRLGELLVHLGYVDQPVVEAFVMEQVTEALWDLLRWTDGRWKFRKNIRAREDVGPPMPVVELLATLRDRGYEWENISAIVHGPAAIPMLSARDAAPAETTLDNDAWSMLCKIDGERSVADLARDCGYTLFEAGQIIVLLVQAGLVDIEEDVDIAGSELYGASTLTSALAGELDEPTSDEGKADDTGEQAGGDDEDVLSRLARLVNEVAGEHPQDEDPRDDSGEEFEPDEAADRVALAPPLSSGVTSFDNPMIVPLHRHSNESFAASIARVSNALSDVLGETPDALEGDNGSAGRSVALKRSRGSTSDPEWQRRKRLRSAAAAELASAQAMVETLRADHDTTASNEHGEQSSDTLVADIEGDERTEDFTTDQQSWDTGAEQEPAEQLEAAEFEADTDTATDTATDTDVDTEIGGATDVDTAIDGATDVDVDAASDIEVDTEFDTEFGAEFDTEVDAAIDPASDATVDIEFGPEGSVEAHPSTEDEPADLIAEQDEQTEHTDAAELERLELERVEAERIAAEHAERLAAEELAWAEYWQLEGDARAAEQAAAEQAEAERIEAERIEAEEAERAAAEQAEADRLDAERIEAERIATEQAEAEQAEAERIAAEEAERVAAEQAEAERVEAERLEAERIAAEEAERIAAEEAAQLAAAEEEAERIAAEQAEVERIEAERLEAERIEAEESERVSAAELHSLSIDTEPVEQDSANVDRDEAKGDRVSRRKAERQAADDAAQAADEAAAATALLVELATTNEPEPVAADETATAVDDSADPAAEVEEADADEPAEEAWSDAGQADTAALLRELSSLGIDDDEPSAPTAAATAHKPRPNVVDKKTKKKIGLFGL
jgi:hypothetical protein